jgi:hypothetical protein
MNKLIIKLITRIDRINQRIQSLVESNKQESRTTNTFGTNFSIVQNIVIFDNVENHSRNEYIPVKSKPHLIKEEL